MATATTHGSATRWWMLTIVSAGFVALTLNWFDIATAFGPVGEEFGVGLGALSLLISLYIAGYAIAHVPAGMLCTAVGIERALVVGLALQGLAGVASGLAPSYAALAVARVASGVGGAVFIGVAVAAVVVWFRDRQVTLALGISSGAAFSVGAVIALYGWVYVQGAAGWRTALVVAGAYELLVALAAVVWFRVPEGASGVSGSRFERAALRASVTDRSLWAYGLGWLGAYGAYFTASQLIATYAAAERGLSAGGAGALAAVIAFTGIPGSVLGGLVADRTTNLRALIFWSFVGTGLCAGTVTIVPTGLLWVNAAGIGFLVLFAFSAWVSVPARVAGIAPAYVSTATGLMLTLSGVGGFVVPVVFADLVTSSGYTAGWVFLGVVSIAFALLGLAGRNATSLAEGGPQDVPLGVPAAPVPAGVETGER